MNNASPMNVSSSPVSNPSSSPSLGRNRTWIWSLTLVCFIFGGLMAMQLRAVERVEEKREKQKVNDKFVQAQTIKMQAKIHQEEARSSNLKLQIAQLNGTIKNREKLSGATLTKLNTQLKELQTLSGLTSISGPGVRMMLDDNPEAAKLGGNSPFLPGIVHDFDLLQIVNELRIAKAEGIAINGRRITGYTPIRCAGGPILINYEPVTPPYRIEAIGDRDTLEKNLTYAGGIVDNLHNPSTGPGLQVKITRPERIELPASESVPRMQLARATVKP